jgi:hypothetical protein
MTDIQTEIDCNNMSQRHSEFDAEAVFNAGSYPIEFDLTFENCVPLPIAKERAGWVIQCLQASYVGTHLEPHEAGLSGMALYEHEDPAGVRKVAIMLEGHPRIPLECGLDRYWLDRRIYRAALADPNAKHDWSSLAKAGDLLSANIIDSFRHRVMRILGVQRKKAWRITRGSLQ